MPMTAAERQKKYIEKLKLENPEKFEEKRKKHLEKVKARRKKIEELNEDEKKTKREEWRKHNKKRAQKKKNIDLTTQEDQLRSMKIKASYQRKSLLKKNNELKEKMQFLNNKVATLQRSVIRHKEKVLSMELELKNMKKRIEDLQSALSQPNQEETGTRNVEMTPITRTNSFITEELPNISQEEKERIKKKIFELNVLSDSLKMEYSKSDSNITKCMLKNIARNQVATKYKMSSKISHILGIKRIRKFQRCVKNATVNANKQEVKKFFDRDDVSRATAGKRETKTKNKAKHQIRYLLDSMANLHEKYRNENGKLSYVTFARHRPFYVLKPNVSDRNTCACAKHSNLSFKALKLKNLEIIGTADISDLLKEVSCDISSSDCMHSKCNVCKNKLPLINNFDVKDLPTSWYQWKLIKHFYTKKTKDGLKQMTTKKISKELINGTVEQLVKEYVKELISMKKHFYNITHQHNAFKACVNTLKEDEVAIICDFSENYTSKLAKEVQSNHWCNNQFTLHTGVLYVKDKCPKSFASISGSNAHDPGAIWAHLNPIIEYTKVICPLVRVVHFFSDGPTTQYRQKKNFFLLNKIIGLSGLEYATWNFFEASHGKGPADGVGGAVKRKLDQLVAYGQDIPDARRAYETLKPLKSSVKLFYIPEESVNAMQVLIPSNLIAIPGTMTIHQIITKNLYATVCYRDLACFCNTFDKGLCECYNIKSHNLVEKNKVPQKRKLQGLRSVNEKKKRNNIPDSSAKDTNADLTYYCTSIGDNIINASDDKKMIEKVASIQDKHDIQDEFYKTGTSTPTLTEPIEKNSILKTVEKSDYGAFIENIEMVETETKNGETESTVINEHINCNPVVNEVIDFRNEDIESMPIIFSDDFGYQEEIMIESESQTSNELKTKNNKVEIINDVKLAFPWPYFPRPLD